MASVRCVLGLLAAALTFSACGLNVEKIEADGVEELERHADSPLAQTIAPPSGLELIESFTRSSVVMELGGIFDSKVVLPTIIVHSYGPLDKNSEVQAQEFLSHFSRELVSRGAVLLGCSVTSSTAVLAADSKGDDIEVEVGGGVGGFTFAVITSINDQDSDVEERADLVPCEFE